MRYNIIYDCKNANCRTPIDTGSCSKECIKRYNKAMGKNLQTNADRIRAMSDEELAKILNAFTDYFGSCNRSEDEVDCEDCELYKLCTLREGKAMEWLRQPAEEL